MPNEPPQRMSFDASIEGLPPILAWLAGKLERTVTTQPLDIGREYMRAFYVDLSRYRLKLGMRAPFIELLPEATRQFSIGQLRRLLDDVVIQNEWQGNVLVLMEGVGDELRLLYRSATYPIIVLDGPAQSRILGGAANSNGLVQEILPQVPIDLLSPYETSSPVVGEQFFGRDDKVRTIRHSQTNYLVLGNRRMGKTSLVLEAIRQMEGDANAPLCVYIDCSKYEYKLEFYRDLVRLIDGPREMDRVYSDQTFAIDDFLHRMPRKHKRHIVLALDEVDDLLRWDAKENWEVLNNLRAVNPVYGSGIERSFRVLMCGHQRARELSAQISHPLYNFVTQMSIGTLTPREAEELISVPMLNLGVKFKDRMALVERIYKEAGGQPNLIQHYCMFMMRRLRQEDTNILTTQMIDEITSDDDLRRRIAGEMFGNCNPLEQLIVLCFIAEGWQPGTHDSFAMSSADGWLRRRKLKPRLSEIENALENLTATGVLRREGKQHSFASVILPRMLVANYEIKYLIDKIREEAMLG